MYFIYIYVCIHVDETAVESNAVGENTELWTACEEKILSCFTCMFTDMVFESNVDCEWARKRISTCQERLSHTKHVLIKITADQTARNGTDAECITECSKRWLAQVYQVV